MHKILALLACAAIALALSGCGSSEARGGSGSDYDIEKVSVDRGSGHEVDYIRVVADTCSSKQLEKAAREIKQQKRFRDADLLDIGFHKPDANDATSARAKVVLSQDAANSTGHKVGSVNVTLAGPCS